MPPLLENSVREHDGAVRLSIPAEDLLRHLLGSRYTGIHGARLNAKEWNKLLASLVSTLERSIDVNVESDDIHRSEMARYILIARQSLESKDNTDPEILLALLGISFELLGGLPDNGSKRIVNKHPNNYRTDNMRTVQYVRSTRQKFNIIMFSAKCERFKECYKYTEDELWKNYHGYPDRFVEWFRETYPAAYAKLF